MFRERKPPPRRLTSTKSDRGFESGFRINPDSDPDVCWCLPKCCEYIILSSSAISPIVVKIGHGNKSPKIPYSAMVREVEK